MRSYMVREYDDIDGNRGYPVWYHEIEDEDIPTIVEQIKEELMYYDSLDELPRIIPIHLYCSVNEELVIIDVDIIDYLKYM